MEQKLIAYLGADVAMMTDRSGGGEKKPLTLAAFEQRMLADPQADIFYSYPGESGCGCMIDGDA